MKRFVISFILAICTIGFLFCDPVNVSVKLYQLNKLETISENTMVFLDDGPGSGTIDPWFEGCFGMAFPLKNNTIILLDYFNLETVNRAIRSKVYENQLSKWSNNSLSIIFQLTAVSVLRIGKDYVNSFLIDLPENFVPYTLFDNLILLGNNSGTHCQYASILVEPDGTWKELNHEESLEFLQDKGSDFRYDGKYLFYKNNVLRGSRDIIDDDGNQYSGISIMINSINVFTMKTPEDLNISSSMFDPEGNFWAVAYTQDEKRNPVIYYAGRDWGYTESPRQGITTTKNLRLRLRADKGALILSSLPNASPVTILKTGPSETIDGLTAPWYKIKTVDGLIGWAFGGYIQIKN